MESQKTRYSIGWFYFGIQVAIYSINIMRMLHHLVMDVIPLLFTKLKGWCEKCKFKRKRKSWLNELKEAFWKNPNDKFIEARYENSQKIIVDEDEERVYNINRKDL
jgi:hypothetical protein